VAELYGFLGVATNNIAEYAALLALLEHAGALRPESLTIRSDSELLIKQMKGEYRVKDPKLRILHGEAKRLLTASADRPEHVPRSAARTPTPWRTRRWISPAAPAPCRPLSTWRWRHPSRNCQAFDSRRP
jgi:hypothetical protein